MKNEMTAMNEILALTLAGVTGVVLGAIFFGGLWLTVNRGLQSNRAALWFLVSLLLRTSIVLCGFYWVGQGYLIGSTHWQRLVACLVGFILARLVLTKWLGPSSLEKSIHSAQEHSHAS